MGLPALVGIIVGGLTLGAATLLYLTRRAGVGRRLLDGSARRHTDAKVPPRGCQCGADPSAGLECGSSALVRAAPLPPQQTTEALLDDHAPAVEPEGAEESRNAGTGCACPSCPEADQSLDDPRRAESVGEVLKGASRAAPVSPEPAPTPLTVHWAAENVDQAAQVHLHSAGEVNPRDLGGRLSSVLLSRRESHLRIAPEKRGGRPRVWAPPGTRPEDVPREHEEPQVMRAAPVELVCRRVRGGWAVGLEAGLSEEPAEDWVLECLGQALSREEGFYRLPSLMSPVTLSRGERSAADTHGKPLEARSSECVWPGARKLPVSFRVDSSGLKGRFVREPTCGLCLVVLPSSWTPNTATHLVTDAEPVLVEEPLVGYLVSLQRSGPVTFASDTGESYRVVPRAIGVRLSSPVGQLLPDDAERLGPLFVAEPPSLVADFPGIWDDIATIVLGAEGGGRNRWRTSFEPLPGRAEQAMPFEFGTQDAGWFFVRLYSPDGVLVDSFDFRYAGGLWFEERTEAPLLPEPGGHKEIRLRLSHREGWSVQRIAPMTTPPDAIRISTATRDGHRDVEMTLGPNPLVDKSMWAIIPPSGFPRVPFELLLRRVWWAVSSDDEEPRWTDHPLPARRAWFGPTSKVSLLFRLPRPKPIRVGFGRTEWREYPPAGRLDQIVVPLRDFGDCPEVQAASPAEFMVTIEGRTAKCLTLGAKVLRCLNCGKQALSVAEMREHTRTHASHYFRALTWAELQEAFPELELPKAIYLCGHHCPKHPAPEQRCYVRSDDVTENPTSRLCSIQDACELCKGPDGVTRHLLYLVPDTGLARRILRGRRVPDAVRCTLCPPGSRPLVNPSGQKMSAHLKTHESQLWAFVEEE